MSIFAKLIPYPREVFRVFTLPFVIMVGGLAAFTTMIHVLSGEDLMVPLRLIASGSTDSLLPFAGFLSVLWLFYCVVYYLPVLYLGDLRKVSESPDHIRGILSRRAFSVSSRRASDWLYSWPLARPLVFLWPWPRQHTPSKWIPGFSPKVEYE